MPGLNLLTIFVAKLAVPVCLALAFSYLPSFSKSGQKDKSTQITLPVKSPQRYQQQE